VLAATCEILLSSLHPYLSCPTGHFNDFDVEGKVTAEAQKVMASVAQWLERRGARIIGVEADGIYFAAAPSATIPESESHLARELAKLVPAGAELRLDGPYPAMFSYDPKNHALLDDKGRIRVTGSVLYPRGLERFRRNCLEEMFRLLLEGNKREIPALYGGYREALETHEFDIALLMKTETLQESLADYQMRVKGARRNPRGVYEIALRSGRDYLEGDQVSYYVTGDGAKVKVNEHCRHVSEWDRHRPDENVEYYKARLRELYEKFQPFVMEES
jgi:DNA polymerase, archaea type